jgi:Amt family ammonium transporter
VFADATINANLTTNLGASLGRALCLEQLKAMGITVAFAGGATLLIALGLRATIGLRPTIEAEQEGLDITDHGEHGYIYDASNI